MRLKGFEKEGVLARFIVWVVVVCVEDMVVVVVVIVMRGIRS